MTFPHPTARQGSPEDAAATLRVLLDRSLALGPEYRNGLSSHLPMALHALQQLGADSARLQDFYRRYGARLSPLPAQAPQPVPARPELGCIEHFARWRTWFERRLADDGVDAVLREMLPVLAPGAVGVAFHGLIRTGHAVRIGHTGELAAALAYWAARYHRLPAKPAERLDLQEWLARLADIAHRHAGTWPERDLIAEAVADRAAAPGFAEVADALDASHLLEVAQWAAAVYARTRNFVVLHVITGSEAAQHLAPWMPQPALQSIVPAVAGGLLASNVLEDRALVSPATALAQPAALPGWPALAQQAVGQHDEHVIKLVAACQTLDALRPAAAWRAAAARSLRP